MMAISFRISSGWLSMSVMMQVGVNIVPPFFLLSLFLSFLHRTAINWYASLCSLSSITTADGLRFTILYSTCIILYSTLNDAILYYSIMYH